MQSRSGHSDSESCAQHRSAPGAVTRQAASEIILRPRLPNEAIPLTYTQQARWRSFQVIGMERNTRICSTAVRLASTVNVRSLHTAVDEIVRRHESLRTRIVTVDGAPMQIIDQANTGLLEFLELSRISRRIAVESEAQSLVEEVINEPTNMAVGPSFRARLLKLDACHYVLVVALDHISADALSLKLLIRDLFTAYVQITRGLPFSLPPMPVQFADFAVWQHKTHSVRSAAHLHYMKEQFSGAERLRVPAKVIAVHPSQPKWGTIPISYERPLSLGLDRLSQRCGTTLALTVLTTFVARLCHWCQQEDVVVGCVTTGRHRSDIMNVIGFFASTIYLRVQVQSTDSFIQLLRRVTQQYWSAIEKQEFGLSILTVPPPAFAQNASFNWLSGVGPPPSLSDETPKSMRFPFVRTSREMEWDAHLLIYGGEPWLTLSGNANGIQGQIKYRPCHFVARQIEEFRDALTVGARMLLEDPNASVSKTFL